MVFLGLISSGRMVPDRMMYWDSSLILVCFFQLMTIFPDGSILVTRAEMIAVMLPFRSVLPSVL